MTPSSSGGKLRTLAERLKQELLDRPRPTVGRDTLIFGLALGTLWLLLRYVSPGYPWSNGRFLVAAICHAFWGIADMLPQSWRGMAAVLRGAILVFLLGLGVWVLADLIGWATSF